MSFEKNWIRIVRRFLPIGAHLLNLSKPYPQPLVAAVDMNNDGNIEVIAVYEWHGKIYVLFLQKVAGMWRMVSTVPGKGHRVSYFKIISVKDKNAKDVVIGWQVGASWSELSILHLTRNGVVDLAEPEKYFSLIEVKDMSGEKGLDGLAEIALWKHDTGEAHKVDIYRYNGAGLLRAYDVYPYYFGKVAVYYRRLIEKHPDTPIYWYDLADAELKQKRPEKALNTLQRALRRNLVSSYPTLAQWEELKQRILLSLGSRTAIQLYPAKVKTVKGDQWGYINEQGAFILQPVYDYAQSFTGNGLAVVIVSNRSGVIDQSGKFIVMPKYNSISDFQEGRAAALDDAGFHLIDESGRVLTDKPYSFIGTLHQGRALAGDQVQEKYGYGYLDRQGRIAIPLQYEAATDFKEGKAVVQLRANQFALIGLNGEKLHTYSYPFVGNLGEGLLAFQPASNGQYGYIDERGHIIIPPQYNGVQAFSDGIAVVNVGEPGKNQYGLINKKGDYVISPQHNDINLLGEGMVSVGNAIDATKPYIGSHYAIADKQGHFHSGFIYTTVLEYKGGYASASDGQRTFFIDKNGKMAATLPIIEGEGTLTFEQNLIRADVDQRTFYLDRSGKIVWKPNTIIPLSEVYRVREEKFKPSKNYLVYYPQVEGMRDPSIQQLVNQKLKEQSQLKAYDPTTQVESSYTGDFSVVFFKKNLLVLELNGYDYPFGAAHGMPLKANPHVDLISGQFYSLGDLFKPGSQYVKVLSEIVGKQIKQHSEEYFPDSYKGIAPNQPFYVLESTLNLYFAPYEIAPYAAGFPTFTIHFSEIMSIINTDGAFWRSFH